MSAPSNQNNEAMKFESKEHAFARDFMFYYMKLWRPEWEIERKEYDIQSANSPLSEKMRETMKDHLENNRYEIQRSFEQEFPEADITSLKFLKMAENKKYEFMFGYRFRLFLLPGQFFTYCLKLASFAALAVVFNVDTAPYTALETIYKTIKELQEKNMFKESSWEVIEKHCH